MSVQQYLTPLTAGEALAQLAGFAGEGRLIAGGTDLMLWLKKKKFSPKALIDITGIEEFQSLEESGGELIIGAAATHAEVALHPAVRRLAPVLAEACGSVGSPQVRNIATVAGNVVSAQPAADAAVALVALGAQAEIISSGGRRAIPVEELYTGAGGSTVDSTREIVGRIVVRAPGPGGGSAFVRMSPREALALPIVNVAAVLYTDGSVITSARLAIGPVARQPFRPLQAEKLLAGAPMGSLEAFEKAAETAGRESSPRDSLLRGSALYRRQLVRVLVRRALQEATVRIAPGKEG